MKKQTIPTSWTLSQDQTKANTTRKNLNPQRFPDNHNTNQKLITQQYLTITFFTSNCQKII